MKADLINPIKIIHDKLLDIDSKEYNLFITSGGNLLFQYLYAKQFKIEKDEALLEIKIIDFLENFEQSEESTFFGGLSGNIWLINYFTKKGIIDNLLIDIKEDLQKYTSLALKEFNNYTNYDFFHGSLGLIHMVNQCKNIFDDNFLNYQLEDLLLGIQKDENGFYFDNWMNLFEKKPTQDEVNFSLAHGITSAVIILSKIGTPKSMETTKQLLQYIKFYKSKTNTLSLYPGTIQKGDPVKYNSRLAWCYGDLGIASAFWQAGKSFHNEEWKEEAINIMLHASQRRDLEQNLVVNAGFCHGASGVAHIFNRFYKETGIKEFDEARWYWLQQILSMVDNQNGLQDYKSWQGDLGWVDDYSLIEGISGIGLVLLGFLTDDINDLDWDNCFLLN